MTKRKKAVVICSAVVLVALAAFIFFRYFFVLGVGTKAGELNQLVYKGWLWKTYEGRLILTGYKSDAKTGKGIQSNEFNFSVVDEDVARELMDNTGKQVRLRYKEYKGTLPWRGMQKYVVYEIVDMDGKGNPLDR